MSLLAQLKKKDKHKQENFPRLPPHIEVHQSDGQVIPFLKLRFGTHSISFEIQCEVPPSAMAMDIFLLFLEQIGEELSEDGKWRGEEWEITNICLDSFTLFSKYRETPLFFWKKKKNKEEEF